MRYLCLLILLMTVVTGCSQPTVSQVEETQTAFGNTVASEAPMDEGKSENEATAVKYASVVKVSDVAAAKFKSYLDKPDSYVRLSTTGGGCDGFTYHLDIQNPPYKANDVVDNSNGFTLVLDKKAVLYAEGTTIGWGTGSSGKEGFTFDNPNAVKLSDAEGS